jgi:hypothetical protein
MKNREKYPNTDDALKAFKEHNKVCDCGCSFEEWLDKEAPSGLNMAIAGVLLGSLFGEIIGAKDKPADKESEKRSNDDELTDVECPICHGKNGIIDNRLFIPSFICPDCGAYVGFNKARAKTMPLGLDGFKSFLADLCTKNSKKD